MERRIGNLEILGTLGKGGMGEVYVAHDHRLDRRVALKSIRAESRRSEAAKARFLREARVLSSLDHPSICRIHDYVEAEDRDYLVLELIEGKTLGRAIEHGLERRTGLRIARDLADVLVAAHAAGVVHRDLKPDNVMVTAGGDIKVLDFGLARLEGPGDEAGGDEGGAATGRAPAPPERAPGEDSDATLGLSRLGTVHEGPADAGARTVAGQVMGTPMFMSPEQAAGAEVTAASDMYSFGLVLQELFTGEPPYESGLDRPSLMERAQRGESRPITGIDRDLASLIRQLKAHAPADRPTAVQAAARLRWIAGKPARRLRYGAAAALVAAAALAGVKYTVDLRRERSQAVTARNDAEDLLTFMIGDLRDRLAPVGRLDVLDAVGNQALAYFARLPEEDLDDDDLFRRTRALRLIGQVRMAEGNRPAAHEAFDEALALARDLSGRDPERGEWLAGVGESVFYLGALALDRGDLDEAETAFDEYHRIARRLIALDPSRPEWRLELAYAHTNRGAVLRARGEIEASLEAFAESLAIKRELAAADPGSLERQSDLANSLSWLAAARSRAGDVAGALALYTEELGTRQSLLDRDPANSEARLLLSTCHSHVGDMLVRSDRPSEALEHYRAMRGLARELVALDPENAAWQRELLVSHRLLAGAWREMEQREAAERELQAGLRVAGELAARDPENGEWSRQRARLHRDLGHLAIDRGDWAGARGEVRSALGLIEPLAQGDGPDPSAVLEQAWLLVLEGRSWSGQGEPHRAGLSWRRAAEAVEPHARKGFDPYLHEAWATALLLLDRLDEARPVIRELIREGESFPALLELAGEKGLRPGRGEGEGDGREG